jgi:hypothetical protein
LAEKTIERFGIVYERAHARENAHEDGDNDDISPP